MKVLFLSDIHLGARYIADRHEHERIVAQFLLQYGADADHIFLLGDVLDYWFEYRTVVPQGYIRFLGALSTLSDRGVKITWLTGNHDIWMFDYLRNELGIEIIDAPFFERTIGNKEFILAHGDRITAGNFKFRFITRVFRNRVCQKLFSAIHPRWTVPFAHRWSNSSRYSHDEKDLDNEIHRNRILADVKVFLNGRKWPDYVVMGHHHLEMDYKLPDSKCRVIVLGEWIEKFTFAEYNGRNLTLHRFKYHAER